MKIKLLVFFIIFLTFLLVPSHIFASSNFSTSYNITYTVGEDGVTHAKVQGTLTNSSSEYYASSYKMQLGFDDMRNIKASDPDGAIIPQANKNNDGYAINLNFNTKSVGEGSKLPFTISFDTSSIAKRFGSIWEINIPGISNPQDFAHFTVNVVVPKSFGKPTYIKPNQPTKDLIFTKEQLGKSGISIAFGNEQLYSFSLKYHLRNDNVYPISTEIALPPSTNYQEIFITQISPPPLNVTEDSDGNWLAKYHLNPTEKKDIEVIGIAKIRLTPEEQPLSSVEFQTYLKEQPYWDSTKIEIKNLANQLKTPREIYNFVIKTLSYDFSRVTDDKPRLGALQSLKNPNSAVCREFTDLFIALSRAAGIPAREVNGFAYTENSKQRPLSLLRDILHAWPEYYDLDKKTWVMVDPTWGNTTGGVDYFDVLDFDHFTFVIKGKESNYPIPAGGYKFIDNKNTKDISVQFTDNIPGDKANAVVTSFFPENSIAGLPISGKITIRNTSPVKIKPQSYLIKSNELTPNQQIAAITENIPPFGYHTWNIKFNPTSFLTNTTASFTIQFTQNSDLENKTSVQTLKVAPFFLTLWGIGGIALGILIIILLIVAFKVRRLRFSR